MAEFPVPIDNLIAYVRALHPDGGPADRVADAFAVSARLDEQSDALIGYFVDQARRSGASWSQIGTAMGVSKQAAQKRFVPGRVNISPRVEIFSQFTQRARNVLTAAGRIAAAGQPADAGSGTADCPDVVASSPAAPGIGATHLAAALLAEPEGLAAQAVQRAGLTPEQVYAAVGAGPAAPGPDADADALRQLSFGGEAMAAVKVALRLSHNYVGTEHLLLGVLSAGGPAAAALTALGLSPESAEHLLAAEFAERKARREAG